MGRQVPEQTIEDDMLIWRFENLRMIGAFGKMGLGLPELTSEDEILVYAPVIDRTDSYFLAGFVKQPPIDITWIQDQDATSVVAITLHEKESRKLLDDIIIQTGLEIQTPPPSFLTSIEIMTEIKILNMCRQIARVTGANLENVFGAVRYTQFLQQYQGQDSQLTLAMGSAAYGVNLSPGIPQP